MSTFVSEFLVLVGTFTRHKGLAVLATTGIILAALYVLILYQRTSRAWSARRSASSATSTCARPSRSRRSSC